MIAFVRVVVSGILKGVLFAALVTIVLLIKSTAKPKAAFLGRIPGTKRILVWKHPDIEIIPGVLIVRIEASIL